MKNSKKFQTFTHRRSKLYQLSPLSMESNVKKFQAGDYEQSGNVLCENFTPLIKSIAHKRVIYTIFGDDAESIAWEFFFEIINGYKGSNFKKLPGLIKKYINFKFYRLIKTSVKSFRNEAVGLDESFCTVSAKGGDIETALTKISLLQEIEKLSARQRELLIRYYFFEQDRESIAKEMNCTVQNLTMLKKKAFAVLIKSLR